MNRPIFFSIERPLGKGGCGEVHLAMYNDKEVAAKKACHVSPLQKAQNYREIMLLSLMEHPNIVTFLDACTISGQCWIIMEYMKGGTLSETVQKLESTEKEIAYVAHCLLSSLSYLHAHLIAHRDVKSSNVMFSVQGEVKLIDFGLAADLSRHPQREETCIVGSPFWISPEMICGRPHSFPTDIWSLGICLLELANGHPPNHKNCLTALINTAIVGVPSPLCHSKKWTPQIQSFIRQCLRRMAVHRPTADVLLQHPFVKKKATQKHMSRVLSQVWLERTMEQCIL